MGAEQNSGHSGEAPDRKNLLRELHKINNLKDHIVVAGTSSFSFSDNRMGGTTM